MAFDMSWVLLGLPLAFVLGWMASRLDLRQLRVENRVAPKAYFKGLNFLLNEQQDKAIDAFIEAVQNDPDTSELHFALGNLFRRRGEFERAVRVHEHLLSRGDLSTADLHRAQHALALDFLKAGLLDRAENALLKLEGTAYENQARLALLANYERSRDWANAALMAHKLNNTEHGSFTGRLAHYLCEQAASLGRSGDHASAMALLQQAMNTAPSAPRAYLALAEMKTQAGDATLAWSLLADAAEQAPQAIALIAPRLAAVASSAGKRAETIALLTSSYESAPCLDVLDAIVALEASDPDPAATARDWSVLFGGRGQVYCRREAGTRTVPPSGAASAGPCREASNTLPVRGLRF